MLHGLAGDRGQRARSGRWPFEPWPPWVDREDGRPSAARWQPLWRRGTRSMSHAPASSASTRSRREVRG